MPNVLVITTKRIISSKLVLRVWEWNKKDVNANAIEKLRRIHHWEECSPRDCQPETRPEVMKESIEEVGRHVAHDLERYLNTLDHCIDIAFVGLLGTVSEDQVFAVITAQGVGDPGVLAEGISEALITTAVGLTVAIPSLMFYRYFRGRVDELVVTMEQEALKMVEVMHGERE